MTTDNTDEQPSGEQPSDEQHEEYEAAFPEQPTLPDDVQLNQGCEKADDPADPEHNCCSTVKPTVEDDTLKLLVYLKCTCGHERRRTIG